MFTNLELFSGLSRDNLLLSLSRIINGEKALLVLISSGSTLILVPTQDGSTWQERNKQSLEKSRVEIECFLKDGCDVAPHSSGPFFDSWDIACAMQKYSKHTPGFYEVLNGSTIAVDILSYFQAGSELSHELAMDGWLESKPIVARWVKDESGEIYQVIEDTYQDAIIPNAHGERMRGRVREIGDGVLVIKNLAVADILSSSDPLPATTKRTRESDLDYRIKQYYKEEPTGGYPGFCHYLKDKAGGEFIPGDRWKWKDARGISQVQGESTIKDRLTKLRPPAN